MDALTHENGRQGRNLRRARFAAVAVAAARTSFAVWRRSGIEPRTRLATAGICGILALVGFAAAASDADEQAWMMPPERF